MSHQSCCVPSCTVTHKDGIALHRFPNPEDPMQIERFRIWVMNIGGDIIGKDNLFIRRNRRVCHNHFEEKYTFPNKRLTQLAVPTLHLPGIAPRRIVPMIVDEPEAHRSTTAPAAHSSRVVTQIDEPNGTLTAASSTSIISGNKTTSLKCGGISSTIIVPMIDEPEAHSSRSAAAAHSSRIVSQCDESNKTLTAVCSTSVFSGSKIISIKCGIGKLPLECTETADILLFFDDLFDSVNGSFSKRVDAKGKVVNTKVLKFAVTPHSPHHKLWYKSLPVLKSMKFVTKRGIKCVVPTITSWIKTIEAYQKITKYLQSQGLNSILLRNFNQDPLENFFGSIRAHGLRNIMPSASAFISSYKALLISNLNSPHSVGANCEDDGNTCLQSLKFFLTDNVASLPQHDVTTINEEHLSISLIDTDDLIKSQAPTEKEKCAAIAYCSGWLIQIIKKNFIKIVKFVKMILRLIIWKNFILS